MSGFRATWNRFWFAPAPTSTLAAVRIAYGLVLLAWTLSLAPDAVDFLSSSGLLTERPGGPWTWSLLDLSSSPAAVMGLVAVLVAAAAALVLGFHTRLASVVAFVVLLSFQRRNPFVDNGGDALLRVLGFSLMLAPAGAALSLDRWRSWAGSSWECPHRAPWALRLMQVQMSIVYLLSVWEKVQGTTWNDGTAVSYALRVEELTRIILPGWITESLVVVNLLTYATLATELALGVLVWNRRARPWVLAAGVALHVGIEATMVVGFFSLVVLVGYVAFIPPETMNRVVVALRDRLAGWAGRFHAESRKDTGAGVLPSLTPTPRTRGGSLMTSNESPSVLPLHRSRFVRSLTIAAAAAALALGAVALTSPPASAAVPGGPGDVVVCQVDCGPDDDDPTFDPTGTADLTTDDPTDDPTGDDPTDGTGTDDGTGVTDGGSTDGSGSNDVGTSGGGGRIVVPTRIDAGAGGSDAGSGGLGVMAAIAGALALVGLAAGRAISSTRSSEVR